MRIHSIIEHSRVNGPGNRFVIWVQGCSIHCKGCANEHIWPSGGGEEISIPDLIRRIPADVDGISITGGEPLDQYKELIKFLRLNYNIHEVFLTTGYPLSIIETEYPEVLDLVDILIDGPFDQDKIDMTPAWRGSTNQGIHLLSGRAQKYKDYKPEYTTEVIIQPNGDSVITGFTVPDFLKEG